MCDAASDGRGGVEHLEVSNDTSSGCESAGETEEVSLSVKTQVQPLRKQKIVVRPVCVRRDPDFKKVAHDTIKNGWIVRTQGEFYNPHQ
jgi:hypothetical protein